MRRSCYSLGDRLQCDEHVVQVQKQRLFGHRVPAEHRVLQDDHVAFRPIAAHVAAVKEPREGGHAAVNVRGRHTGQQQVHDPLVEQYLVVELRVGVQRVSQTGVRVFELQHQIEPSRPVLEYDVQSAVQHIGRVMVAFTVFSDRFERRESTAPAERPGMHDFGQPQSRDQRVHRVRHDTWSVYSNTADDCVPRYLAETVRVLAYTTVACRLA